MGTSTIWLYGQFQKMFNSYVSLPVVPDEQGKNIMYH